MVAGRKDHLMTAHDFRRWREHMKLSQQAAADALGLSKASIELYERGSRRDDDRPVSIPRTVELACAALVHGIRQYTEPQAAPVGSFQVIKIDVGDFGEAVSRTVIGPPFPIRSEAEAFARNEAGAFHASDFNQEHGYWWGRNASGKVCRFIVRGA
jgi:transcriptional regulator with XRE-family HTH domain